MVFYNFLKNFFKGRSLKFIFYVLFLVLIVIFGFFGYYETNASSDIIYHVDYLDADVTLPSWLNNDYYYFFSVKYSGGYTYIKLVASKNEFTLTKSGNNYNMSGNGVYNFSLNRGSRADINYIQNQLDSLVEPTNPDYLSNSGLVTYVNETNYLANFDIKNTSNTVVFPSNVVPPIVYPEILTTSADFVNLSFDVFSVNLHDFSTEDVYLLVYDKNYEGQDSYNNLYPVNEILLNYDSPYYNYQHTTDPTTSAIYWIPRQELGLKWIVSGVYSFRFAKRVSIPPNDFSDWAYEYLTEDAVFTLSANLNQTVLDEWNKDTEYFERNKQHDEIMGGFSAILDNNVSNENENSLNSILGFNNNNSDLENVNSSFFSRLSTLFESFLDYDNTPENLEIPIPNTEHSLVFPSDYLSRNISNTLYTLIQMFWTYVFGMYAFKFLNNLCIALENGDFIDPNKDPVGAFKGEVILSNML